MPSSARAWLVRKVQWESGLVIRTQKPESHVVYSRRVGPGRAGGRRAPGPRLAVVDPWAVAAVVAGYLIGSVDFGVVVPRLLGVDIYGVGSGNPGTTNVLRSVGKGWAAVVLIGDLLKGLGAAALGAAA
ncbi:MAG: glycerol-3-phosphate acyltransferase, partial [Actinobacteria bacterium]|nr:glycerol-3-phosphate acyltransferase [Actinomycetota bacterium]